GKITAPSGNGKAAPDGQAVTRTAATPGDGQATPGGYAPGAVATGGGEAGREAAQPAFPAPPPSAMRGLLPGRRFRQRRSESAPDAAAADQASYERPPALPRGQPLTSP